jgi:transposase
MAMRSPMKQAKPRRVFSDEFKRGAVRQLLESGKPLDAVARELGLTPSSLFSWRLKYTPAERGSTLAPDERTELEALRKKVAELEEDKAILKKAAVFFAKESAK